MHFNKPKISNTEAKKSILTTSYVTEKQIFPALRVNSPITHVIFHNVRACIITASSDYIKGGKRQTVNVMVLQIILDLVGDFSYSAI